MDMNPSVRVHSVVDTVQPKHLHQFYTKDAPKLKEIVVVRTLLTTDSGSH